MSLVDSDLQEVGYSKKTELFPFGNFVIMPAHLRDRFIPFETQDKLATFLHLIEQLFTDIADYIAKGIDITDMTLDAVLVVDRLEGYFLHRIIDRHTDARESAAIGNMTCSFRHDIR